ncbi:MAG: glycine rich domain-containing protein [Bacilli bacterium]|nr:glycine rich domain-containing protein [Bacilli bacterium]
MKLNNKGFAITSFLYSIFAIFLVILSLLIISMTNSKITLDKIKDNVKDSLDDAGTVSGTYEKLFNYTGNYQTFTAPYTGWYKMELWGAQGAASVGKGAYVSGKIYLNANEILYVYAGEGLNNTSNDTSFNGGTGDNGGVPGGGATDIRLLGGIWNNATGLKSRIIIAAGSGSGSGNSSATLGAGGTLIGSSGGGTQGGTQLTYGAVQNAAYAVSSFGIANGGCSGGNGYYPGGGANCIDGAGGGSSFISGYAGVNAITSSSSLTPTYNTIHYSGKYFIDGYMESSVNAGNGYAKITYLSSTKSARNNTNLDNVRYIKDCINGNDVNSSNHWVELQAIKDGINVAKNTVVTSDGAIVTSYGTGTLDTIVDGDITSVNYSDLGANGLTCITVDLGKEYDLDEIAVWHYWAIGMIYNNNVTYVSDDNISWTEVINNGNQAETPNGKRVSAY